jgi:hypothetical protein
MNPLETVAVYIEANDGLKAGIPWMTTAATPTRIQTHQTEC